MIFGDFIFAGIIATAAFLQAESGGWKLMAAGPAIAALGFAATAAMLVRSGNLGLAAAPNGPDALKFKALAVLPVAGVLLLAGSVAGSVVGRRLSPVKTGGVVFVCGYLLINLFAFTLFFGALK